jgi:N-acetyl-gamma-glutamyl-phosphate reductase
MTARVFIDGGAGTTGLQIAERLEGRADIALIRLDDAQRKDPSARRAALNDADLAILCLPDDAAREAVALIDNDRTRVIDASTAHRIAPGWVYGFPEVSGRDSVANARFVSNPGCYSTGFIAVVAPLVKAGLIRTDALLSCNAVSGYSGGGKAMIAEFEGSDGPPSAYRSYALALDHKHVPEMRKWCNLAQRPLFAPAVAPVYSGMLVDVPLHAAQLTPGATAERLREALAAYYNGSPIVTVASGYDDTTLPVELLKERDDMRLFVFANADETQFRLVAALDNLGKGASGAAVQNLNLMLGLDETAGLRL